MYKLNKTTEKRITMSTVNLLHAIATCKDEKLKAKMIAEFEAASKLASEQHQKDWAAIKNKTKKT
jgi:hypothetical protein